MSGKSSLAGPLVPEAELGFHPSAVMKKTQPKMPKQRNVYVLQLIERAGAGAGKHKNRTKRSRQVPRRRKHKGSLHP